MTARSLLFALVMVTSVTAFGVERIPIKPTDFKPLLRMPWNVPGATMEEILDAIFREPEPTIRYQVLAEYLRQIPIEQFGQAFDMCVAREGAQTPDEFVGFFIRVWADRDPVNCWERTRKLFELLGIPHGWLGYDSWKNSSRIWVQNLEAIRASPFWLSGPTLREFPLGVNSSTDARRFRIMREFSELWYERFDSWPGYDPEEVPSRPAYSVYPGDLIKMTEKSVANLREEASREHYRHERPAFEMALRCWMIAEPEYASVVIDRARHAKWRLHYGKPDPEPPPGPSLSLLMLWATLDLPAIIRWADKADVREDETALGARAMLMSRVDAATRKRWLAEAKPQKEGEEPESKMHALYERWGAWDPETALEAAVATNDADTLYYTLRGAACGPWPGVYNARHYGLGVIQRFPMARLPKELLKHISQEYDFSVMLELGDVDIGETARHGLEMLKVMEYAPRENLIKFFGGDDIYGGEDGMIDRTFCALRVWAVVKPEPMKAWIATLEDAEMKKALTWLLEHPWGTAEE